MAPLTEEQKKKIKDLRLKAKPLKPGEYKPGLVGAPAKRIQAAQPGVGEIAKGVAGLGGRLAKPFTDPLVTAAETGTGVLKKGVETVAGAVTKQKRGLAGIEGRTEADREILALEGTPAPRSTLDPVTQSAAGEPSATDTGRDEQTGVVDQLVPRSTLSTPAAPTTDEQTVTTGTEGQAGFGKITATKGARRTPMSEAEQRFRAPVARPATRAERGLTPVGPNNSGRGFGARPRSERDAEREIQPPRSPGDQIRYRREIRERDKTRELTTQQERTDTARTEATARTDIAGQRLAGEQEQQAFERDITSQDRQKMQSLQEEFADPETTDTRRSMIEREIGVMGGKPLTQRSSQGITENQRANVEQSAHRSYQKYLADYTGEGDPLPIDKFIQRDLPETYGILYDESQVETQGGPPQSAVDAVRKDPSLMPQFMDKYYPQQ